MNILNDHAINHVQSRQNHMVIDKREESKYSMACRVLKYESERITLPGTHKVSKCL